MGDVLLLESGFAVLLEDGSSLLLEVSDPPIPPPAPAAGGYRLRRFSRSNT